jgi:hypothetical protein
MKNSLGAREQALLRLYVNCQLGLSPSDFYSKWNVTHAQMAQICGCSVSTVDRWFLHGSGYRAPEAIYLRRLAEINFLWENTSNSLHRAGNGTQVKLKLIGCDTMASLFFEGIGDLLVVFPEEIDFCQSSQVDSFGSAIARAVKKPAIDG